MNEWKNEIINNVKKIECEDNYDGRTDEVKGKK